jgi:FtsH-binding integral membrane protein
MLQKCSQTRPKPGKKEEEEGKNTLFSPAHTPNSTLSFALEHTLMQNPYSQPPPAGSYYGTAPQAPGAGYYGATPQYPPNNFGGYPPAGTYQQQQLPPPPPYPNQQQYATRPPPPPYPTGNPAYGGGNSPHNKVSPNPPHVMVVDVEGGPGLPGSDKYVDMAEKSVRMGFIRKVYGILSLQLLTTLCLVLAFSYSSGLKGYVQANPAILWVSLAVTFVMLIALSCFPSVARTHPTNLVCLAAFTLAQSLLVGVIASTYSPDIVVKAVVTTALITAGLTLFAFQTKIDFTAMSSSMFVLLIVLILFGVWTAIFPSQVAQTAYAALGAFVFSLFIVYDSELCGG